MNLQKKYGFSEPFRYTGPSTGRRAVRIINNQYPQNQISDCLNRFISRYASQVCCRVVNAQAIMASLFARAQVTTKLHFRPSNSLTQSANLPDWYSSFCMNIPAH
jgi:hypothetical protein